MNIQFDKTSAVSAELTLTLQRADYQERVEKAIKNYRRRAQMPGFRPGQVPMSLIKKRFGDDIAAEEMQRELSERLYGYLREEKVNMLGEPLASEKQPAVDLRADEQTFVFDIALAPEFDAKASAADHVPYYHISVTDDMVDRQVGSFAQRHGHYDKVDTFAEGDMVKGHLAQLDAEGNIVEGGFQREDAVVLPGYFKDKDERAKFDGVATNTVITINPSRAYEGNAVELASLLGIDKEQAAGLTSDFSYQITEITRYVPGELNQELFDSIYGEGQVNSEAELRQRVRQDLEKQFDADSRLRFIIDLRQVLEQRVGTLEWPDQLLRRIMRANNPDKDDAYFEKNYQPSIHELEWHLIKEQLADQASIKVEQDDVMAMAREQVRMQFAQYGMANVPEELVNQYAGEQLKKRDQQEALVARAVEQKIGEAMRGVVTLDEKTVTLEEFNKLFEAQA